MDDKNEQFYLQPSVKEFDAVVTGCAQGKNGWEVTLDRTAFYPEGGGQLADCGKLGSANVTDTRHKDGHIVHFCDAPLEVGSTVHGELDWTVRFDHMQAHSGEHIVSGLAHKKFGYDNVGFHMAADRVTVDFDGIITDEQLAELEREANEAIWANTPVTIAFPSPDELKALDYRSKKELSGEVRIVTFPSVDVCACCGTHVMRTGEVGQIRFLSMSHYKGGVRIEMLCGRLAMLDAAKKTAQTRELCQMFSAKPGELVDAVKKYAAESEAKDARLAELTKKYFDGKFAARPDGDDLVMEFEDGFKTSEMRKYCDALASQGKARVAACFSPAEANGKSGFSYVMCSRAEDMREASKALNKKLNGRGGGDNTLVQGSFFASRDEIEAVLTEMFR
ncbi:MAG: alanyl-tRNA editing protein [Pyramidobacter sp.]|nr:alanyl-tRNA editing protein [Pyramidobacter sp.]